MPSDHKINEHIAEMLKMIVTTAEKDFKLIITKDEQKTLLRLVANQYTGHKKEYHVRVSSADQFKFLAWAGIFLYSEIKEGDSQKSRYLAAAVAVMWELLQKNNKDVNVKLIQKLTLMVKNHLDKDKNHLSTGKNGLYMAFRFANESTTLEQ